MTYLTDRQQKMIIFMFRKGSITKKDQYFYTSPFFYTQIGKLGKIGLTKTEWIEGHINYKLTELGKKLGDLLSSLFEERLEEDKI